jgi:hypothetical protein
LSQGTPQAHLTVLSQKDDQHGERTSQTDAAAHVPAKRPASLREVVVARVNRLELAAVDRNARFRRPILRHKATNCAQTFLMAGPLSLREIGNGFVIRKSEHLVDDLRHLSRRKSSQRFSANVPERAETQGQRHGG